MRGKSNIAIGEVTGIRCETTVRNVVLGELRLARRSRPTSQSRQARPKLQHLVDDSNGYVCTNVTHMIPVLILHIKMLVLRQVRLI